MSRTRRLVDDRLKALLPVAPSSSLTLAGARAMSEGLGGREFPCTISGHYRTRIFEFPGIIFRPTGDEPPQMIYSSRSVQAYVVSNLMGYFEASPESSHFAIAPSLRHIVAETEEKIKEQHKDRVPVFVVIEEFNQLAPVEMVKGECVICEEVIVQNAERIALLVGGRDNRRFVVAFHTVDGAWPEPPSNQRLVNLILAGIRAGQRTTGPIGKYVDNECFVTDDNRFVAIMRMEMSADATVLREMDAVAYRGRMSEIQEAIAAMGQDIDIPHLALLADSMYSDERKDDSHQRLQYLRLHQSLTEAGAKVLDYQGDIRNDDTIVGGNSTLRELKEHRDDIAHWWADSIDGKMFAGLRQTVNELIRHKYFPFGG